MSTRARAPDLHTLLESIYAATLDSSLWTDAVEQIRIATHASTASLNTIEVPPEQGGFAISRQTTAADYAEYIRLAARNPWTEGWKRLNRPQDCVVVAEQLSPWSEAINSTVYQEYFKPRDMHDSAMAFIHNGMDGVRLPTLLLLTHPGGWAMKQAAVNLLEKLLPHMQRALKINGIMAEREGVRRASLKVLQHLSLAAIVVSQDRSALYLNPEAERLIRSADGLTLSRGKLKAAHYAETERLDRLIHAAVTGGGPWPGGFFRLARPSGKAELYVAITPVNRDRHPFDGLNAPAAIVTVRDPEARVSISAQELRRRLGLTLAESRVLSALIAGHTPAESAERLQLSVKTVRMHLSHLFQKTGTRSQADLLRFGLLAAGDLRTLA
jgi:DNA-binding CsgD family transcriptional regulator